MQFMLMHLQNMSNLLNLNLVVECFTFRESRDILLKEDEPHNKTVKIMFHVKMRRIIYRKQQGFVCNRPCNVLRISIFTCWTIII